MKENGRTILLLAATALLVGMGLKPLAALASVYRIVTNYPNPFDSRREVTTICYFLSEEADVRVKIYDLLGNLVREYPSTREYPGVKRLSWDGTRDDGSKVTKGGYICVVEIAGEASRLLATRKIGVVH